MRRLMPDSWPPFELIRFGHPSRPRIGVAKPEGILPLAVVGMASDGVVHASGLKHGRQQ